MIMNGVTEEEAEHLGHLRVLSDAHRDAILKATALLAQAEARTRQMAAIQPTNTEAH